VRRLDERNRVEKAAIRSNNIELPAAPTFGFLPKQPICNPPSNLLEGGTNALWMDYE
jgi:hypothetical protein